MIPREARGYCLGFNDAEAIVKAAGGTVFERGEFVPGEPYLFVSDPDGYIVELWYELPTTADPKRPVTNFFWSQDSKVLLFVQDRGGDENFRVYAVDPTAAAAPGQKVPEARDLTPYKNVQARILAVPEKAPNTILVGLNDRDPKLHDVYRVDLTSGERRLVFRNDQNVAGWVAGSVLVSTLMRLLRIERLVLSDKGIREGIIEDFIEKGRKGLKPAGDGLGIRERSVRNLARRCAYDEAHAEADLDMLHTAYHAPGTGSVFWRSDWTTDATWAAFIAGPYTESHAHRDQGSLLIYRHEWLAYDQNIESHSGLVQQEHAHNLVRIDEGGETVAMVPYQDPAELVALHDTPEFVYLAADITPIYGGAAAIDRRHGTGRLGVRAHTR